jgi:hypothetical protein
MAALDVRIVALDQAVKTHTDGAAPATSTVLKTAQAYELYLNTGATSPQPGPQAKP